MNDETQTGYTRAQLADAVDEAHEALHHATAVLEDMTAGSGPGGPAARKLLREQIERAHEALHNVGAGLPRVGCATPDPEAQAAVKEWLAKLEQELPCGHKLADLISGPGTVTKCGQCLADQHANRKTMSAIDKLAIVTGLRDGLRDLERQAAAAGKVSVTDTVAVVDVLTHVLDGAGTRVPMMEAAARRWQMINGGASFAMAISDPTWHPKDSEPQKASRDARPGFRKSETEDAT